MTGRRGSPGGHYVRYSPGGRQPERYPPQASTGYPPLATGYSGASSEGPVGTLLGPGQPHLRALPPESQPGARQLSRRRGLIDYPRAHHTGVLRWIPSWRLLTGAGITTAFVAAVALLAAYAATPIPPIDTTTEAQTTTVYYRDGKTVLTQFAVQNRTIVPLKRVPDHVRWAVISAEDRTFYSNKGVSPIGILRAGWNNARGGSLQGGSTITQQYVKNTRIGSARTVQRKIKEFFISIKINNQTSKQDILQDYLNTIYFGRNTYGIEAAAKAYFGKDVSKLTLAEGAYLAGIINGPELYDPDDGDESRVRALTRFNYVLDGMVELGRLTPEQRAAATFKEPKKVIRPVRKEDDQTIYLEQMVRAELARNGRDFAEISRGGYKIYTTFDKGLISEAKKSVHDPSVGAGERSKWPKRTEIGLVSLDPRTGAVRAIYGGNGSRAFSAATQDAPQAGSVYKPFTLLAALEGESKDGTDGISLKSRFSGRSPYRYDVDNVGTGSNKVTNFGGEQFGKIDLLTATEHSVNTVYAQLNEKLDVGRRTREAALRAGLLPDQIGDEVSNTLGNGTPHVVDMASAYGTIAAQGERHPYYVIEKIVSPQNGIVYTHDTSSKRREFSKAVTADATFAMRQVIDGGGGTGSFARNLGRPAAGKTGTVGGQGRETMAAWFVGFTPQLSTAVVIHRLDSKGGADVVKGWGRFAGRDMQGGMFPVRIWTDFMKRALDDEEVLDFPEPAWVGVPIDPAPEPVQLPEDGDPPFVIDGQDEGDGRNDDGRGDRRNRDDRNGNPNGQGNNPNGQGNNPNGQGNNPNGQDNNPNGQGNNPNGQGNNPNGQDNNPNDPSTQPPINQDGGPDQGGPTDGTGGQVGVNQ